MPVAGLPLERSFQGVFGGNVAVVNLLGQRRADYLEYLRASGQIQRIVCTAWRLATRALAERIRSKGCDYDFAL